MDFKKLISAWAHLIDNPGFKNFNQTIFIQIFTPQPIE